MRAAYKLITYWPARLMLMHIRRMAEFRCPCYGPLIIRARRKKWTITWAHVVRRAHPPTILIVRVGIRLEWRVWQRQTRAHEFRDAHRLPGYHRLLGYLRPGYLRLCCFAGFDACRSEGCQASKTAFRSHCARPYGTLHTVLGIEQNLDVRADRALG